MSKNMRCDCCAIANECKIKNTRIPSSPKGCNLSVAVPHCKDCEFCEKIVEETTWNELYFCKRMDSRSVGKMDFCSWGSLKPELVSRETNTTENKEHYIPNVPQASKKKVFIYTDGACKGNPGPGGWGSIVVFGDKEKELGGGEADTTNNRMEITAVIEALSILKEPCSVTLTTDSKYVVDSIEKGWAINWKRNGWRKSDNSPALNADLWKKLLVLLESHEVSFVWVKGHNGHPYNERCDKIACSHANKIRK